MSRTASPFALTAIGAFLVFAASMASLAAITLTFPGTPLDRAWKLNPRAYAELKPLGPIIGIPFFLLACSLGMAAFGWFRRRRWGWLLATTIIAIQIPGDIIDTAAGHLLQGLVGATIASALLMYVLRPSVRSAFPPSR